MRSEIKSQSINKKVREFLSKNTTINLEEAISLGVRDKAHLSVIMHRLRSADSVNIVCIRDVGRQINDVVDLKYMIQEDYQMDKKIWPECNLSLQSSNNGIMVSQKILGEKVGYVARGQELTQRVVDIFDLSLKEGFCYALQKGHPRDGNRFPNKAGVVYLSLGHSYDDSWAITIDDLYGEDGINKAILINKKYTEYVKESGIPFDITKRSAAHLVVQFENLQDALRAISPKIKNDGTEFAFNKNRGSNFTEGVQLTGDADTRVRHSTTSDGYESINVTIEQYQDLKIIAKFLDVQISDMGGLMAEFFIQDHMGKHQESMKRLEEAEAERDKILKRYRTPCK